jgi:hypothetical protein
MILVLNDGLAMTKDSGSMKIFSGPTGSSSLRGLPMRYLKKMFVDGKPKQAKFIINPGPYYLYVHECQPLVFLLFLLAGLCSFVAGLHP